MQLTIYNVWTCVYEATPDELSFLQHDVLGVRRKGRKGMESDSLLLRYATPPMFPTGWLGTVLAKCKEHGIPTRLVNMRRAPCVADWSADISWLYPHQLEAVKSLVKQDRCLLEGATGSGKGEIIPAIMRVLKTRWLLLVRGRTLMHQLAARIEKRLGEEVGKIGDGEWTVREKTSPQRVVVCMSQSLNSFWHQPNENAPGVWHPQAESLLLTFGGVVGDEVHGTACIQDTRILQSLHNAYYRYGFSATTTGRSDKRDEDIVSHFAPIGHEITATDMQAQGRIAKTQIYMHKVPQQNIWSYQSGGYTLGITLSPARNAKIASIWKIAQKPCLTYFKELAHGQNLKFIAEQLGHKVLLIDGSTPEEARKQSMQAMEKHEVDILLGSKALREGVDLTHVRSEINGSGDKSPIGVIQQKGRGERICHDDRCQICAYYGKKTQLTLHDFYDYDPTQTGKTEKERHWLENHSIERLRAYESRGYKVKIQ